MFYVGQKVVCVDASQNRDDQVLHALVEGKIYTVSRSVMTDDGAAIDIIKAPCPPPSEFYYDVYGAFRFRPVVATDISIFTAMLNNVPLHERERV